MATPGHPNMWIRATRVRFFWLLVALVGFILVAPALPPSSTNEWETAALVMVIFFAASYVSQGMHRIWLMVLLAMLLFTALGLNVFSGESIPSTLVLLAVLLLILGYTSVCVLSFVLDNGQNGQVGAEHIYGAICTYVLVAMVFATIDFMLELMQPGSFTGIRGETLSDRPWWQFFYFSVTTLSTVGYGDIVPATMRARSFVIIEQLIAIFYVAILISRLTGMYNTGPASKDPS